MPGVGLTEDEPAPAPLHHVAVPAALLEDTLGLEAQRGLQVRQGAGPEKRAHLCAGSGAWKSPQQEGGEDPGLYCEATQVQERIHERSHRASHKQGSHAEARPVGTEARSPAAARRPIHP